MSIARSRMRRIWCFLLISALVLVLGRITILQAATGAIYASQATLESRSAAAQTQLQNWQPLSQWSSQATQSEDCGPASVAMIVQYYGLRPGNLAGITENGAFITSIRNKVAWPVGQNPNLGTSFANLESAVNSYTSLTTADIGATANTPPQSEIAFMKSDIAAGRPVIIFGYEAYLVNNVAGFQSLGRPSYITLGSPNHWMVLDGISADGSSFYVSDPDTQYAAGGSVTYTLAQFSDLLTSPPQWPNAFAVAVSSSTPAITSPSPGSTLSGSSATFSWSAGSGVSQYFLYVGSIGVGSTSLYSQSTGTATSATVSGLPTNGQTLNVRLWWLVGGAWQFADYTYTAANSTSTWTVSLASSTITPQAGQTITLTATTNQSVTAAGIYFIQIYNPSTGTVMQTCGTGTSCSVNVSGLAAGQSYSFRARVSYTDGSNVLAQSNLVTVTVAGSASVKADITSPVSPSRLSGSTVTFQWSTGSGVSQYFLYVGNAAGGSDIYGASTGTATSATVSNIPTDGRTIFVRIWSLISGSWQYNDDVYSAANVSATVSGTDYCFAGHLDTTTLVNDIVAQTSSSGNTITIPVGQPISCGAHFTAPATGLVNYDETWTWGDGTSTTSSQFTGSYHTYSTTGTFTVTWTVRQCFAGAITACVSATNTSTVNVTQVTWGVTLAASPTSPQAGQTLTLTATASQDVQPTAYVIQIYNPSTGTVMQSCGGGVTCTVSVTGLLAGQSYSFRARISSFDGSNVQAQSSLLTVTVAGSASAKADITSPVSPSRLAGSSVTFQWSTGSAVSQYFLYVGSSGGSNDIYGASTGTATSATVNNIPTDGRTIYVRIWSLLPGGWQYNDDVYSAANVTTTTWSLTLTASPTAPQLGQTVTFTATANHDVSGSGFVIQIYNPANGSIMQPCSSGTTCTVGVSTVGLSVGQTIVVAARIAHADGSNVQGQAQQASFTVVAASNPALTTPAPNSTLTGGTVTFSWSAGSGVSQYYLYVGSTGAGSSNLYGQSTGTATSATVSGLPTDGRALNVRLWWQVAGAWQYTDYSFTAYKASNGATVLASCSTAFNGTWNSVAFVGATQAAISYNPSTDRYGISSNLQNFPADMQSYLISATGQGTVSAFRQGNVSVPLINTTTGTGISVNSFGMVGEIPSSSALYGSLSAGAQFLLFMQYNVQTSSGHALIPSCSMNLTVPSGYNGSGQASACPPQLASPTAGATLTSASQTFTWAVCNATGYWLYAGSTGAGSSNIFSSGQLAASTTSATANNLPGSGTLYVRLWFLVGGAWQFTDYTFTLHTGN